MRQPAAGKRDEAAAARSPVRQSGGRSGVPISCLVGQRRVAQIGSAVQVVHVRLATPEDGVIEHRAEQIPVGLQTVQLEAAQRPRQAVDRSGPVLAVGHELGHQRIVGGAHDAAGLDGAVGPQSRPLRPAHVRRRAGRRPVVLPRPFGAEPDLHRVSRRRHLGLASGRGRPAATASCSPTRSSPVTSSVTPCSTCSRVFISRKEKPLASTRYSTVPTPT